MIVVIDTNCLLVSLPRRSEARWLFDALLNKEIQVGVSNEILGEYEEIIGSFFTPRVAENVVNMLTDSLNVIHVTPYYKWNLIVSDADDNKFVDCAIACNADYIITEDRHFRSLNSTNFPKVIPIGLLEFKHILDSHFGRI